MRVNQKSQQTLAFFCKKTFIFPHFTLFLRIYNKLHYFIIFYNTKYGRKN